MSTGYLCIYWADLSRRPYPYQATPQLFSSHFIILRDPDIYPLTALHTAHIKGLGKFLHKLEINCCQVLVNHFPALASLFILQAGFGFSAKVRLRFCKFCFIICHAVRKKRAVPLGELGPAHGERRALVFGSEGPGLTRRALACCDRTVIIPMARGVDSLNVAASSAVAFWQLFR